MAEASLWPAFIGLLGVVVGAGLTTCREVWNDRRRGKKDKEFLGINVAASLERFAAGCLDVARDDGTHMGQPAGDNGQTHTPVAECPTFEPEQLKVEWRVLDAVLLFKILDLPRRAEIANRKIAFLADYDDPPHYSQFFETRQYEYARLGLMAWTLAQLLRSYTGLPQRTSTEWSPVVDLENVLRNVESLIKLNAEAIEQAAELQPPLRKH
jgi:hypothetical protein